MSSHLITEATTDSFRSEVIDHDGPVLVDFWAAWCTPCLMLAPVMESIAEKTQGKLKVVKVNTDENPELAGGLMIRSLPTIMFVTEDKNEEGRRRTVFTVGVQPEEQLMAWMQTEGLDLE